MTRFYFDIRVGEGLYPDEEGLEFRTQKEAEVEVAQTLAGLDDNLNVETARIITELENTQPGPQRDLLERKLRQLETASHIDGWLTSPGLQPSEE
ncbi:hypothetical protein M2189_005443 [Bradyrhizobium japonicum]|uniref:DUF6894 family protein n=1 Tax=Bradyrhizobium japonicum TaxID=375 RepID=UPI002166FE93|nr:hypothetical protein [Bradyrhizobium japonicum]MCS3495598.1 hypothetical protein [Bradyrhizobium japonicum]MCS3962240.1 hypothetical protein [Bradyrhizobium japonicum]MCS3994557.1 hypothetical protein [Bradyrhizobium japonicum]